MRETEHWRYTVIFVYGIKTMTLHRTPTKTNAGNTSMKMYVEYCKSCDKQLIDGVQSYACTKCTQKYHKECIDESIADKRKMVFICNNCCNYRTRVRAKSCDDQSQLKAIGTFKRQSLNSTFAQDEDKVTQNMSTIEENDESALENLNIQNKSKSFGAKDDVVVVETVDETLEDEILNFDLDQINEHLMEIRYYGKKQVENEVKKNGVERTKIAIERMEMLKAYHKNGVEMMSYRELLMEIVTLRILMVQMTIEKEANKCNECPKNVNTNENLLYQTNNKMHEDSEVVIAESQQLEKKANENNGGDGMTSNFDKEADRMEKTKSDGDATSIEDKEAERGEKTNENEEASNTFRYEIFCRYDKYLNHGQLREIYSRYGQVKIKNVPKNKYALIKFERFEEAMQAVKECWTKNDFSVKISSTWSNYSRRSMKMELTTSTGANWQGQRNRYRIDKQIKQFDGSTDCQKRSMHLGPMGDNPFRTERNMKNKSNQHNNQQKNMTSVRINPFSITKINRVNGQRKSYDRMNDGENEAIVMKNFTGHGKDEYYLKVTAINTNMSAEEIQWTIKSTFKEVLNDQNVLSTKRINGDMICTINNINMDQNELRAKLGTIFMPWEWIYEIVNERTTMQENNNFLYSTNVTRKYMRQMNR